VEPTKIPLHLTVQIDRRRTMLPRRQHLSESQGWLHRAASWPPGGPVTDITEPAATSLQVTGQIDARSAAEAIVTRRLAV
jgi:hypothetical protein